MNRFKSVDDYKPSNDEEFMNEKMLDYFRSKLLFMKENLLARYSEESLNEDLRSLKGSDMNDRATMEEEASLDLKSKERLHKSIEEIDRALEKIASGNYGYCEETGNPISVFRLDAMPTTLHTVAAQEFLEKSNGNRPL